MLRQALILLLLAASPAHALDGAAFDPAEVDIADAINCHLYAPSYNAFAWALSGEEKLAERFGWRKIESPNPFLAQYELPQPVLVTGTWSTRRTWSNSTCIVQQACRRAGFGQSGRIRARVRGLAGLSVTP